MCLHREQRTFIPFAEILESSKLNLVKQEAQVTIIENPFYYVEDKNPWFKGKDASFVDACLR